MSTDKPLVAFAHIMLSLETKLVKVYSNAPWGDLDCRNVELFIQKLGEPVQISESLFWNLKELTRIPTPKQTIMSTKPESPNYTQLSMDKFSVLNFANPARSQPYLNPENTQSTSLMSDVR